MKLDFLKSEMPIKREREKHITRLHLILVGLVLIAGITTLIVLSVKKNNTIARYKKLEKDLTVATKYYVKNNKIDVKKGTEEIIAMKTIVENGYLQDELTKECIGYTVVQNTKEGTEYKILYDSYIKCGKTYQTFGYEQQ